MGYHPREEQKNAVYYCEKCSYRNVDRVCGRSLFQKVEVNVMLYIVTEHY